MSVRYSTDMPDRLAEIARRNLAQEDATIGRFNAVASQIPGQALPVEQPPVSTTTAPVAAPASGLDPYVADRHAALQNALANNVDPDKPALYVNPKRRQELLGEFYKTTEMVHQNALEEAQTAHENLIRQKDIAAANATTRLAHSIAGIKHEPGTPEHETALAGAILDNIGALDSKSGAQLASLFTAEHDKAASRKAAAAALQDRLTTQQAGQDAKLPVNQPANEYVNVEGSVDAGGNKIPGLHTGFPGEPYKRGPDGGFIPVPEVIKPEGVVPPAEIVQRYATAKTRPRGQAEATILENAYPKLKELVKAAPVKKFVFNPKTKKLEETK